VELVTEAEIARLKQIEEKELEEARKFTESDGDGPSPLTMAAIQQFNSKRK
jgi:hypothetical protein